MLLHLTATIFVILEQTWCGTGQPTFWQPLGLFRVLPPFHSTTPFPIFTKTRPQTLAETIGRPVKDNSVPAGTDVAAITALENAILSNIGTCGRTLATANLGCPCGQSGKRCADPLSLCNLRNQCICDGSLGYADAKGISCTAYVIPTTTRTSTVTTTSTTTTTPSTTIPPTTMTTTTTRTTTATTTTMATW